MKGQILNILRTSALSVLLGTSVITLSAEADDGWSGRNDWSYNDCFDSCNPCCAGPRCALWADFLWWEACQTGLDTAVLDSENVDPSDFISDGETQFFDYRYKPGFRVGVSYFLPCDSWSIDFQYTMWHPKQHHTYTASFGGAANTTQLPDQFLAPGAYSEVHTELKTKYDLYDLVFAKVYRCVDCFGLRPYIGARVLQFRQNFQSEITPIIGEEEEAVANTRTQWRTDLPAAGLTFGVGGKYQVCGSWNLVGRLGASLLGGRVKHHNQWFAPRSSNFAGSGTEHRHHCSIITGWEAALGIGYDWCCCNMPVGIAVGYEIQDWWNMPQRPRFVNQGTGNTNVTPDDGARFSVHGVFVRAGIAF